MPRWAECDGQTNSLLFVFNLGQTHFTGYISRWWKLPRLQFQSYHTPLHIYIYIYIYQNIKFMRLVETATRNERQRYRNINEPSLAIPFFFFFKWNFRSKGRLVKIMRINSPSRRFERVCIRVRTPSNSLRPCSNSAYTLKFVEQNRSM